MNEKKLKKIFVEELDKIGNRILELNKKENPTQEEQKIIARLMLVFDELQYIEILANQGE